MSALKARANALLSAAVASGEVPGVVARQREIAEQIKLREAEARKQAEFTRQRQAEAKKQAETAEQRRAEIAKLQPETAKKVEPPKSAEPVKLAASSTFTPVADAVPLTVEAMLQRAITLEGEDKNREAARLLGQAVREGRGQAAGQAAKRLGDMLQKGAPGVSRDYGEALRYYEIARLNGVEVMVTKGR